MGCHSKDRGDCVMCLLVFIYCLGISLRMVNATNELKLRQSSLAVVDRFLQSDQSQVVDHMKELSKREVPRSDAPSDYSDLPGSLTKSQPKPSIYDFLNESLISNDSEDHLGKTDLPSNVLYQLFNKYGHDGVMTFEGFEQLLIGIGLQQVAVIHDKEGTRINKTSLEGMEHALKTDQSLKSKRISETEKHNHYHNHEAQTFLRSSDNNTYVKPSNSTVTPSNVSHIQNNVNSDEKDGTQLISSCPTSNQILQLGNLEERSTVTISEFAQLCPTLIYILDAHVCDKKHPNDHDSHRDFDHHDHSMDSHSDHHFHGNSRTGVASNETGSGFHPHSAAVWGYSIIACLIISAIGLLAVAIIPIMHHVIYNHLLHFLVALAIGSLSGDALLHLLPHAVMPHVHNKGDIHANKTGHELDHDHGDHDMFSQRRVIWCGLTALTGIMLFFIVERLVGFISERRHLKHASTKSDLDLSKSTLGHSATVPLNDQKKLTARANNYAVNSCEEMVMMVHSNKDIRKLADDAHVEVHRNCENVVMPNDSNFSHAHGKGGHQHSHEVPKSVAAVAWVVIVGDGFHNFADGIAIGSAFASSLTGGLSTSIAVICHELPHELGDFAMLLKAGMSPKKALIYNCVSSLLCLFGIIIGVALGNIAFVSPWIFSLIAGMFLYIALVDMLPEMKSVDPRKGEHPFIHFGLQLMGMLTGSAIMLLIALFEDQISLD